MIGNVLHSVTILIYHSINDISNKHIRVPNMVTPENFYTQMEFLASSKKVVSLEEFITWQKTGGPIPEECFVITFDDGYKDNYIYAYPILQKFQLPATFFLATNYIGSGKNKWEDQLNFIIRQSDVPSYKLEIGDSRVSMYLRTGSPDEKLQAINRIINHLKRETSAERERVIDQIVEWSGISVDQIHDSDLMLSWDDICKMAENPGISFGSHSQSHLPISTMSDEQIYQEVAGSKYAIETVTSHSVKSFSFPYGEEPEPRTVSILKSCQIDCAVSGCYGMNYISSDLFRLKRINVSNQTGKGFWAGLLLRRSIGGEPLRKLYNVMKHITAS